MAKKVFTDESLATLIDEIKSYTDESVSTKANKSHSHAIADVSGLQSALDGKAASSHGTHVSYSTTAPVMDGTASVGTATTVARSDHKHPTDTSRASKTEFDTHASDTTKHITSTERTNWGAAYTHSQAAHAPSNAEKNQNAFSNIAVGSTTVAADTATDTVTFVGSNVTITPDATNDKITFAVADGTTSAKGVVKLENSTSSTSTTTAATPSSVKSAYDLANTAKTNAATAQSRADSAYSLAEGKVDSLSDLGITATATELNYMDGVTSNVQTQLDSKADSSALIGESTTGTEYTIDDSAVTAGNGAEIFNAYTDDEENYVHANIASGMYSHAEGATTVASGDWSHAEGIETIASGNASHAEGEAATASGRQSHAEGYSTTASGMRSHAEGQSSTASAQAAHAEGYNTQATATAAHSEGYYTEATGKYSHAEGYMSKAQEQYAHAEGYSNTASGEASHAEGYATWADGNYSHTEGSTTTASGDYSHAEGFYVTAAGRYQHVQGKYNIIDKDSSGAALDTYAHIVGNGTTNTNRSNAHTIDWDGNGWFAGDVYVGGTGQDDTNASKVITEVLSSSLYGDTLPTSGKTGQLFFKTTDEDIELSILKTVYPIGSIYMSISNANPNSLFGFGTWERIQDTFLLAAGSTYAGGSTGGEAEHTLTVNEMPSHKHNFGGDGTKIIQNDSSINKTGTAYPTRAGINIGADWSDSGYLALLNTGGGQPHNNMPPYLSVYMWKRTA